MISLHNIQGAGDALQYFSGDNYYTQDEGLAHSEWFGEGSERLGLSGKVDREAFFGMLQGQVEGEQIGRWVRHEKTGAKVSAHRPGIDLTFSAPKSVSVLAEVYGRGEVREAHEGAVKAALAHVEKNLIQTRQTRDGKTEAVETGNLVVALFRHNTSRDLDPQTHTHALIMNATQREDGQWRSISNEELYRNQRLIGAIYTSELAQRLQALGYEITRTDEKGNFEVAGFTQEQLQHFSQRRAEIVSSLKERGIEIEDASARVKEAATLKTRARKLDVDHGDLLRSWKDRAQQVGIEAEQIVSRAQAQRQRSGERVRPDALTGLKAMEFASAHLVEREVVVSRKELIGTALEHGVGRVGASEVMKAFAYLEAKGDLVRLPDGNFTTRKMLSSERWALEQVRAQKGKTPSVMQSAHISARIDQAQAGQGFTFSDGQREAITKVLGSPDRYVGVQGLAGTGKTSMLRALKDIAQEQGYTVRGMAPTGAAAKVLSRDTGMPSDTVSMFMIKERQLQKQIMGIEQAGGRFARQAEIWIVDESSFLPQHQKAKLDLMAERAQAKVVYLGDVLQLQAVEAGKPFELAQRGGMDTAYMTEINRQKTASLQKAVDIIVGRDQLAPGERLTKVELNNNARAFAYLDRAGMVHELGNKSATLEAVARDVLSLSEAERGETVVITPFNKDRIAINGMIREGLKVEGVLHGEETSHEILVSKGWTKAMQQEAQYYTVNDVVRFGRNYQQIDAQKDEYMRVAEVRAQQGVVVLRKENGTLIEWLPSRHNKIEVYDTSRRELAIGDRIRMTRGDNDFKNGDVVRVVGRAGEVVSVVDDRGHETGQREVDLSRSKHWDHAYVSTIHAAQGVTQRLAIFHIRAPDKGREESNLKAVEAMAKIFGRRSFYVGTTRASHELRVYTNDKQMAAKIVAGDQDKTSAVETLNRHAAKTSAAQVPDPAKQMKGVVRS